MEYAPLKSPKLAAIDLDDTLLGPDRKISSENHAAIERLRERGVEVLIATGRHLSRMRTYLDAIGDYNWAISCQGAAVYRRGESAPRFEIDVGAGQAQSLIDQGIDLDYTVLAYTREEIFALVENQWTDCYTELSGAAPILTNRETLLSEKVFYKVLWLGLPELIDEIPSVPLPSKDEIYQVRTTGFMHEFLSPRVNKAVGVAFAAKELGVSPDEILAFGDGDNDAPLLEWAGFSVAMRHGSELARASADALSPEGNADTAFARSVDLILARCP